MKELSIIIVHYKRPDLLKLCLNSIKETVQNIDYEVIVVDSETSRQSKDLMNEEFSEIIFLPFKENLGYSRGVNVGLKKASGNFLFVLNPDIILTEGATLKMLDYIKEHKDIGMIGPKMLSFNGLFQNTYFSFYKPATILARRSFLGKFGFFKKKLEEFLMADSDHEEIQTPDWLMGSAMMLSREALNKVGLMDERFFMYFEDVDWARRFWHNGFKVVYFPNAVIYHYHQRESKSRLGILDIFFNKKTRWHIKSAIKFFVKYRNLGQAAEMQLKN